MIDSAKQNSSVGNPSQVGPFRPAWWCRNPHFQTMFPPFFRRRPALTTRRERLELPDGDFVDLNWVDGSTGPLVVVLHGLAGSIESPYALGMLKSIQNAGGRAVFMHFRNCSEEPNRLERLYHSGETEDLRFLLNTLRNREPDTVLCAVGYSMGANILLKYLGEEKEDSFLKKAAAVSTPFQLEAVTEHMTKGVSRIYQKYLLQGLIESAYQKYDKQTIREKFNVVLEEIKTLREWDDLLTAPVHGFRDADHYYSDSSSRQYIKHITTETLIIQAIDDPFMPHTVIPTAEELSPSVRLEVTSGGGHVGFVSGSVPWKPVYWLEQRIPEFFFDL